MLNTFIALLADSFDAGAFEAERAQNAMTGVLVFAAVLIALHYLQKIANKK